METVRRIASFSVDHDFVDEGIYVSRIDGDVTSYDLRTRKPNAGDYMDNVTMHSLEHMFATYVRNSTIGERVIYFGPMGCRTGFYLLVRDADNREVLSVVKETLLKITLHEGEVFGKSRKECGNYLELDIESARCEAKRYLDALNSKEHSFLYRTE
ncbi:MAG: S-ribosylhomocysteine lyase [Clostridia bacterium]|nr:S-ribosylhomocysteine lyase [Clostridia bacterium]